MSGDGRAQPVSGRDHWETTWGSGSHERRGWYQAEPEPSLDLVLRHTPAGGHVLDAGGGASLLVDRLLDAGRRVTVVDIAEGALEVARTRLGDRADQVTWVRADVTDLRLDTQVDTWHDRAALHFLLDDDDRAAYAETVATHVRPGGYAVIGTFAPDGWTHCSGLPVRRQDADAVAALLGDRFTVVERHRHLHHKPSGEEQAFSFVVLRRTA